ncbi:MAG: sulfatase-like hydrolase/transferase, partial [Planctomycetaceae bacterium]|nr:sulfatase-like hydrolase/transferase [Planctomycetaceae bacterium]
MLDYCARRPGLPGRLFIGGCLLSLALLPRLDAAADRPNVLVILADDLGYSDLGCYGGEIETPNLDALARAGLRFTQFYNTARCWPTRAAILTGYYAQQVRRDKLPDLPKGVRTGGVGRRPSWAQLLPVMLKATGYRSYHSGKWHLDGSGKPQWEPKRRFGFEDNRFMFNRGHWKKFENTPDGPRIASRNKQGRADYGLVGADEKSFATDWLTDKVIDFVKANKGKPFCYMVSYPDPHGPNTVRKPYDTMYADAKAPIPRSIEKTLAQTPKWGGRAGPRLTADTVRAIMPKYYGMVKCLDDNVGRILETLRKEGRLDRTLIVFTSDHGDLCGEHGRLNKGVPYEGSARIPFLLHCPGKVPAG